MLSRLLQIREGESTRALLLFTYLFLVVTSYVVTKSTRDALFLEQYSAASLPYADIASSLSVGAVMAVYLRLGRRAGPRTLMVGSLVVFSVTSFVFWGLTGSSRSAEPFWMLPVLYVWASVYGVLLPAQVWMLANHVLTTREAKRLYGIIGSGAIMGWIVGGMMTKAVAARLGTANLLLMTGIALALCPLLVTFIWRERGDAERRGDRVSTADDAARRLPGPGGLRQSFAVVWRSPHLRAIAGVICLSSLVTTVAAWQFRAIAKSAIPETDALAAFFGTFNVYAGLLSLATQLFLTSRVLRRFGLGVALLVVPLALTAGSFAVLIWASIGSAVLLKGSDQVLRYSIDRSTVELLYLPVPEDQTRHAKAFIDTVVWRIGDCLGAICVLAGVVLLGLSAPQISIVTIVLLGGWIAAAATARRQYVNSLRTSLFEHRVDAERLSQVIDRSTSDVLTTALRSDDPSDILYALNLLKDREAPLSQTLIQRLLDHPSADIRREAIALLTAANDATVVPQAERLLEKDPDPSVRAEALIYLARMTETDPLARLERLEDVGGASISSAMAIFLARPGPTQKLDMVRLLIDGALTRDGAEGEFARVEAARLLATLTSSPGGFDDQLLALVNDPVPAVARQAIRAAGVTRPAGNVSMIPAIVARLGESELTAEATIALAAFGDAAVPDLARVLHDAHAPAGVRRHAPDVLLRIATVAAEHALVEVMLDADPAVRLRVVSALNKLRQLNPERRLEGDLVETVLAAEILGHYRSYQILGTFDPSGASDEAALVRLRDTMTQEVERIFRLMKLLLPGPDLHSAYEGLRSSAPDIRANAVEYLEHALPPRMRELLMPLLDNEVSVDERIAIAERMAGTVGASEQMLAALAASEELRAAARDAANRLEGRSR
ncbi:MAG: HEAT repeat domain-containing protein [Acidobacteriia bacterium]|nr:HEAT repeat domain-containing protein [Terriglobia bacterium]